MTETWGDAKRSAFLGENCGGPFNNKLDEFNHRITQAVWCGFSSITYLCSDDDDGDSGFLAGVASVAGAAARNLWFDVKPNWPVANTAVRYLWCSGISGGDAASLLMIRFCLAVESIPDDSEIKGTVFKSELRQRLEGARFPIDYHEAFGLQGSILSQLALEFRRVTPGDRRTVQRIHAIALKNSGLTWPEVCERIDGNREDHLAFAREIQRFARSETELLSQYGIELNDSKRGRPVRR